VGVWVGADDARPIGLAGSDIALPIWADVMVKAIRRTAPSPFTPPPGIVMTPVDSATGLRACGGEESISEAFRQGSEPAECDSLIDAPVVRDVAGWFRGLFR
jgi:membrane carboxypeptidase/penicillin-binding protein